MPQLAIDGGVPIRQKPIYYAHQYIDDADIQSVVEALKSDYLTQGPAITKAEEKLCEITGAKYAVLVASGTAALHAACFAAGIGEGDEVITTPITFAASANGVLYCGGMPVFADIDPETYNIDPKSFEERITAKTKAVIAVDYTGQAVQIDEIKAICQKHNLLFIEDAAHSIGTKYNSVSVGNIADMTAFSFHPVKTVTAGEGGAVMTNSKDFHDKLVLFRSHGITRQADLIQHPDEPWYYDQIELGYNYRITDIQAALLLSQLDKLDIFKARRSEIVRKYNEAFSKNPVLRVQKEIPQSDTCRHLYILQFELSKLTADRKQLFLALKAEGVCCNVHYVPTYYFPYYKRMGYEKGLCPNAERLYEAMITLPLYVSMSEEDVGDVIIAVTKVAEYYRR